MTIDEIRAISDRARAEKKAKAEEEAHARFLAEEEAKKANDVFIRTVLYQKVKQQIHDKAQEGARSTTYGNGNDSDNALTIIGNLPIGEGFETKVDSNYSEPWNDHEAGYSGGGWSHYLQIKW